MSNTSSFFFFNTMNFEHKYKLMICFRLQKVIKFLFNFLQFFDRFCGIEFMLVE
jgi:hypothetical protein